MTRNLKALMLASMAALAMTASAAQAHTPALFNSTTANGFTKIVSSADGTAKNSHHVIDAAGASLTCTGAESSFFGTMAGSTAASLTITPSYNGCTFLGQPATVNMGGCDYLFKATGELVVGGETGVGSCIAKPMVFSVASPPCVVTVPTQKLAGGVGYTNIEGGTKVTVEAHASGITYAAVGSGCPTVGADLTEGNYTTGNTILEGIEDKEGGGMVNISQTATVP